MKKSFPRGLPDLEAAQAAFARFCETIAALRDPEDGCPWDLEQDHVSLRRYMLEEAYEAAEAMAGDDAGALCDELGDVLLQVVLNAQVAKDQGNFSIVEVIEAIDAKMRRRHPHVFDKAALPSEAATGTSAVSVGSVKSSWAAIKAEEKAKLARAKAAGGLPRVVAKGIFDGVEKKIPATTQAFTIGKLAAGIHFDWDDPREVLAKLRSEVDELEAEMQDQAPEKSRLAAEAGDIFFSLAQLCRHLDLDPETCAMDGNRKFLRRFASVEALAVEQNIEVSTAPRETLERLWLAAKEHERSSTKTLAKS